MKSVTAEMTEFRADLLSTLKLVPYHHRALKPAIEYVDRALTALRQPTSRFNLGEAREYIGAAAATLQKSRLRTLPDRAIAIQQQIRTAESLLFGVN